MENEEQIDQQLAGHLERLGLARLDVRWT